jgi:hypothetical protein
MNKIPTLILIFFPLDAIRVKSGASLLKNSNVVANKPNKTTLGSQNSMAYSSGEDDLEIIEVKAPSASLLNKYRPAQAVTQAQALAAARQKLGLMGAGAAGNSMMGPTSMLGNPYASATGQGAFGLNAAAAGLLNRSPSLGQLDILQACKIFKFV